MKFCELSAEAKWRAVLWFNSVFDEYGVNGGDPTYPPCDVDEFNDIAETNGYEFDENGNRINF